jgi:ABC-type multidrug transport system fused ATPase/permease subunit
MVTRYADGVDMAWLFSGLFAAMAFGATMPAFCFYFGNMIDGVAVVGADSTGGMSNLSDQAFMMLYIGIGAGFMSWFQVTCLSIFAENIQFKIKIRYFQAVLEKDATWFDNNNPTEMASRIAKEVVTIQRGSGEKIG